MTPFVPDIVLAFCPLCGLQLQQIRPDTWECPRHPVSASPAKQHAQRAIDAVGHGVRVVVLVYSPDDPFHVEVGVQACEPSQALGLVELAHFKLRVGTS